MLTISKEDIREIVIVTCVVVILYQIGWLLIFLLVPLQLLYLRRGIQAQYISVAASFLLLLLFKAIANFFTPLPDRLMEVSYLISLLFFASASISLVMWNVLRDSAGRKSVYASYVFPGISLFFGVANAAAFFYIQSDAELLSAFAEQLSVLQEQIGPLATANNEQEILKFIFRFAVSSAWFSAAFILLLNHVVAVILAIYLPIPGGRPVQGVRERLEYLVLSNGYLWLFIAGWGLVLLSFFARSDLLEYSAWNIALFSSLLYAIQGYAVALRLVSIKRPDLYRLFIWGSIISMFIPMVNIMLPVVLQLLGLSVHWVRWKDIIGRDKE